MYRISFGYAENKLINILIEKDHKTLYDICRSEDKSIGIINVYINKGLAISLKYRSGNDIDILQYNFNSRKYEPLDIYTNIVNGFSDTSTIRFSNGLTILSNNTEFILTEYCNGKKISSERIEDENINAGINASFELLLQNLLNIDKVYKVFQGDNSIILNVEDVIADEVLNLILNQVMNVLIFV